MISFDIYDPEGGLIVNRSLDTGRYSIGRGMRSDIRIRHRSLARRHAVLEVDHGRATIRAQDGEERLYKDGGQIGAYGPLLAGDVVHLGACELRVLVGGWSDGLADAHEPDGRGTAGASDAGERDRSADTALPPRPRPEGGTGSLDGTAEPEAIDSDQDPERVAAKRQLEHELIGTLDLYRRDVMDDLSENVLRQEARDAVRGLVDGETVELPAGTDREQLVEEVVAEAVGYGPLEPLLSDPRVTEVMVNGPERVYVERDGALGRVATRFANEQSLLRIIERIVTSVGRRIDESSPMVDARLPDGSRVNAIIPPLSLVGPSLTIRKFNHDKLDLHEMVALGTLSEEMAEFLRQCVLQRRNILVSGGTGSGKTTFLNALSEYVPERERIVTIEDAAELRLHQEHLIPLEARPANMEGKGAITIRDLVRNALRMRPDRIIVGECRGQEALDMLQAMNTGHDGSLTTGHANSPRDLLSRLEVMVLMAGMDLPVRAIREQIASAIDVVIQQARFSDGRRRVTSIVEVNGMENDVILMQKLFEFRQRGIEPDGRIVGKHVGLGYAPSFYEELREAGVHLDTGIFGEPTEEAGRV